MKLTIKSVTATLTGTSLIWNNGGDDQVFRSIEDAHQAMFAMSKALSCVAVEHSLEVPSDMCFVASSTERRFNAVDSSGVIKVACCRDGYLQVIAGYTVYRSCVPCETINVNVIL